MISHRKLIQATEAHLLSANVIPPKYEASGYSCWKSSFLSPCIVFLFRSRGLGNTGDRKPRVSRVAKDSENNTNELNDSIHLTFWSSKAQFSLGANSFCMSLNDMVAEPLLLAFCCDGCSLQPVMYITCTKNGNQRPSLVIIFNMGINYFYPRLIQLCWEKKDVAEP